MNFGIINAILLYVFSIPVVMEYRIMPIVGTPYWLFGILFLILTLNILISLYPKLLGKSTKAVQSLFLWATVAIVLGGTTVTAIGDRAKTAPEYGVHDIILQQEAAMRYLIEGKNPYKETYFGTPLEKWNYDELGKPTTNPALYHFVMPPWYLIFPFSIYFVSIPLLGYFDGRMVLLVVMAGLLVVLWKWFKNRLLAALAVTLTALSPATADYFIEGRSDLFAFFWLVWSLYLLDRKKLFWSAVMFGLAIASKQTIWFAVPFYAIGLWITVKKEVGESIKYLWIVVAVVLLLFGPFILWDAKAFLDSLVYYLSGSSANGYPVSGYGLGMLLYEFGIIKDIHAYYPFSLWQFIIGVPFLYFLIRWMMREYAMSKLLLAYGVFLSVIWYFSRYFNNSHLGFIGIVFAIGVLKHIEETQTA